MEAFFFLLMNHNQTFKTQFLWVFLTLIVMPITALCIKHVAMLILSSRMSVKKPFKEFKSVKKPFKSLSNESLHK